MAQVNLSTEKKIMHLGEQTCGCQGRGGGIGMDWEFGVNRWTLNILKIKAEKFIDKITGRNQILPFTVGVDKEEPEKPKELTEDDYLPYNAATGQYRAGYKPKK